MSGGFHVFAAALAVAVIFEATRYVSLRLKFAGAASLIGLGAGMIRAKSPAGRSVASVGMTRLSSKPPDDLNESEAARVLVVVDVIDGEMSSLWPPT